MWPCGASSNPNDADARQPGGHQDHRLLLVARGIVGIGLAHQDVELAARVAGAARPPLAAVDHVMVAVALDAALDVGRIRRGDVRLGHEERRADPALEQGLEPLLFLLLGAVALDRLHVARVRRRAVEHLGRPGHAPHDFA